MIDPTVPPPPTPRRRRTTSAATALEVPTTELDLGHQPDESVASCLQSEASHGDSAIAEGDSIDAAHLDEDRRVETLSERIGLALDDPELLRLALTHRSIIQDVVAAGGDPVEAAIRTNERLEFLGDAVLGAIAAAWLYHRAPDASEGDLTRQRVALVRAETLVRWARELGLGDLLYLGHGERPSDGARDRMLAGAFEAVLGAIAVDRGYLAARSFLYRFLERDAPGILGADEADVNPKGRLQEILQERYRTGPGYRTLAVDGPAHQQVFTVQAMLGDRILGEGAGGNKREAQQAAAAAALRQLDDLPAPAADAVDQPDPDPRAAPTG